MRSWFAGRRGVLAAFAIGIVIATAATAGAASLITGKQIKDGTIGAKDLTRTLRTQVAAKRLQGAKGDSGGPGPKGDAGAQGPKGDAGAQGPAAVKVDADIVSPAVATVTAAKLGALSVSLSGCQDTSGGAVLHLASANAATIAISWSWNGTEQVPRVGAIGPGNDQDFPVILGVGYQLLHGVYRDAAGDVSTLELVLRVVNSGGNVRTCRVSGALVPTS